MGNEQAGVDDLRLFCMQKRTMLFLNDIVPNFIDIVLSFGYNVLVILCVDVSPMAEMISVREAAVRWNITERRVATLCKNGRIAGAKKQGNRWLIPADTQKPADQRISGSRRALSARRSARRSCPCPSACPTTALHRRNTTISIRR